MKTEKMSDLVSCLESRDAELEITVRRLIYALDVAIPYLRERVRGNHITPWDADKVQSDLDTVKAAIEKGFCALHSHPYP